MSSTLRINSKPKIFLETGSVFDATELAKIKVYINFKQSQLCIYIFIPKIYISYIYICIQQRPGGHDNVPTRDVNPSAFSYNKRTEKPDPINYTKKYTGTGGTLVHTYTPIHTYPHIKPNS